MLSDSAVLSMPQRCRYRNYGMPSAGLSDASPPLTTLLPLPALQEPGWERQKLSFGTILACGDASQHDVAARMAWKVGLCFFAICLRIPWMAWCETPSICAICSSRHA